LKIEKELLEDHQIKLNVEIDADPFEKAKRQAARKIAKQVKVPGFRPGKAPYNVILRQVGESAIVEEAMEFLIDDIYPKVLKEADVKPYGPGSLEKVESLDPPSFHFVIPLAPEVELGDYKALELAYEVPEVTEEEIDQEIATLLQQQAITEKSEEPAIEGDRVFFQVSADRAEVTEGEEANIIPERFNSVIVEAKDEDENQWPFPGFSANLKGMSIDESKDIIYTYSEDHDDEELQGVEAVFHVMVTNIQKVTLPELDDEFAKAASDFDTLDELKADIKERLVGQKQYEYDSEYNSQVVETLVEQSTIKSPPQMLEDEKKEMLSNLEYRLSQQGINLELYLQIRGITEEELEEEMAPMAENRIKRGLVLAEIAQVENLQVDQQQLAAETGRTMEMITRGMTPKDVKEFQKSDYLMSLVNSIMADMMTQESMNYLRAIAKGDPLPGEGEEETETEDVAESPETEDNQEPETASEETSEETPTEDKSEPEAKDEVPTPEVEVDSDDDDSPVEAEEEAPETE
jgi:trigger factor